MWVWEGQRERKVGTWSGLFVGCLPCWDGSCRPNFLFHPVTVYWRQADQSQHWPYNARRLECQFWSHWYDSTPEKSWRKQDSNPGSSALEGGALTTRPTRRSCERDRERGRWKREVVCLLVSCLQSQQQPSVSQGPICTDNFTCCHTEVEVADPTFYLTQSQKIDTGLTSPNADLMMSGAWQGSH